MDRNHLFFLLLDPSEREHIVEYLFSGHPFLLENINVAAMIKKNIFDPLSAWLQKEFDRLNGGHNTATEAGRDLILHVEDMIDGLMKGEGLQTEMVSTFSDLWKEFQVQMGFGGILGVAKSKPLVQRDRRRQGGCKKGGFESGRSRRYDNEKRDERIAKAAGEMIEAGKSIKECILSLSERNWHNSRRDRSGLSARQIRNILYSKKIIQKKMK